MSFSARNDFRPMKKLPWHTILLFLFVSTVVLVTFLLWGESIDAWLQAAIERSGENRLLIAVLLYATLASDILLPIPSCLASTLCGMFLGLSLGFLTSFLAMSTSAALGYWIGLKSSKLATKIVGKEEMETLQLWQSRGGPFLLLALRPVPILAEASLVFAGLGRYPVRDAIIQVSLGNALVSAVYAVTGAYFAAKGDNSWLAFIVTILFSAIFMIAQKLVGRHLAKNAARA